MCMYSCIHCIHVYLYTMYIFFMRIRVCASACVPVFMYSCKRIHIYTYIIRVDIYT